jgi:hypothetical protein
LSYAAALFSCFISTSMAEEVTAEPTVGGNCFKLCIGKDTLYGQQIQDVRVKMERSEFQEKAGGKLSAMRSFLSQSFIADAKIKTAIESQVDAGRGGDRGAATFSSARLYGVRNRMHPRREIPDSPSGSDGPGEPRAADRESKA